MRTLIATLCLTLAAALAPAQAAAAADSAGKDRLTIGISQFPSTFHPMIDAMLAKSYILGATMRPLTVRDPDWELVCMLCTELPTLENGLAEIEDLEAGGEGVALTFTIHPEAAWGDGTPVTTDDVVFTWEVGKHPESGVTSQEGYRRILDIDVRDDKTFTLHVDRVTFDYNDFSDFELLPAHLEREVFEQDPATYRSRTRFDTDPTNPGLAFGPYRLAEVASGSHVVLEPNPTWHGDAPAFDRIVVKVIENTAALEANLLAGGVDMIAGELGLTIDQALAFEKRHGDAYDVLYQPGLIYEHVDLNLDHPILSDPRVRKALIMGLDREALNQQLFEGRQPVADTNVNPLDWVYNPDVPKYQEDLGAAGRLLDEAGWSEMRGGVRHNAAGEPLRFTLMTTAGNRIRELVEQVLQSQWRRIGVDAVIENEPARVFFGETTTKRRFDAAMFAWISAPESVPRTTLHSEEIPTAENNWSGQNFTGYSNPEMDELIDAIEVTLDRDRREALWHRLQEIYAEDLPAIPLYFRADAYILPKWLEGVRPTGHKYPTTLWVEHWRPGDGAAQG